MTLQQLIYFKEIAMTGSFTRAAENLYTAQSSLSHAIQSLEREIGAPLFIRTNGRQIQLSDYGKAFLPYVENMLSELKNGQEILELMTTAKRGTVNIAYSFINGCVEIPKLFRSFYNNEDYAGIHLQSHVNHGGNAYIEEHLTQGIADLALSCYSFDNNRTLASKKLYEQQLYVAIPSDHPLSKASSLTIHDIKDEFLIVMSGSMSLYDFIRNLYADAGIVPKMIDGLSDWTSQLDLIACNRGISILPEISFAADNISFVPLDNRNNKRDVYLLWPNDRKLSPATILFKSFCIEYFESRCI